MRGSNRVKSVTVTVELADGEVVTMTALDPARGDNPRFIEQDAAQGIEDAGKRAVDALKAVFGTVR